MLNKGAYGHPLSLGEQLFLHTNTAGMYIVRPEQAARSRALVTNRFISFRLSAVTYAQFRGREELLGSLLRGCLELCPHRTWRSYRRRKGQGSKVKIAKSCTYNPNLNVITGYLCRSQIPSSNVTGTCHSSSASIRSNLFSAARDYSTVHLGGRGHKPHH